MTRYRVFDTIAHYNDNDIYDYYVYFKGHVSPLSLGETSGYQPQLKDDVLEIIDEDAGILIGVFDYADILAITATPLFID